jgi:molecular chaperone DnaK
VRGEVDSRVNAVREAMNSDDVNRIRTSTDELRNAMQRIGSAMYGQEAQPGQPGADGAGPQAQRAPEEGTVEGEFREV